MATQIRLQLQQNVARYIGAEIALSDFESWFNPVLWSLADSGDELSREFAGLISNVISECSGQGLSEEILRSEMTLAIRPFAAKMRSQAQVCQVVINKEASVNVNLFRECYLPRNGYCLPPRATKYGEYLDLGERFESELCLRAVHQ